MVAVTARQEVRVQLLHIFNESLSLGRAETYALVQDLIAFAAHIL